MHSQRFTHSISPMPPPSSSIALFIIAELSPLVYLHRLVLFTSLCCCTVHTKVHRKRSKDKNKCYISLYSAGIYSVAPTKFCETK